MLFPHVKISSFRAKAHLVFHWCLYNKQYSLPVSKLIFTNTKKKFIHSILIHSALMRVSCLLLMVKDFKSVDFTQQSVIVPCWFVNSWLRHPKIKENWKTVTAAFLLFVAGLGMYAWYWESNHVNINKGFQWGSPQVSEWLQKTLFSQYAWKEGPCQLISRVYRVRLYIICHKSWPFSN